MSIQQFWEHFSKQDTEKAIAVFELLSTSDKSAIFSELFQKSAFARNPMAISILYRELHDGKTFDDFYHAWFPPREYCNEIKKGGEIFQLGCPAPTRVYNAINRENSKEVLSIGFTWVDSEKQGKEMADYMQQIDQDKINQIRHENISHVAKKISSTLYEFKTSDNLGVPFQKNK
ncbi:MAG: hypothetical protein A3E81_01395 [Gammaproteobacteria bacterium RIFCSPHIGHO2_12_FULL_36_30]|nr:MAG: hypothetical protein A3E81_01395 [Gammaproteobacteria bacterium RIFCSPHIGHO2_12_FULL_36_30]